MIEKTGMVSLLILTVIVLIATVIFVIILANSSGKLEGYQKEKGILLENNISEKIKLSINGVEQGVFLLGKNIKKPVILFLHGGPGSPEYAMANGKMEAMEENFIMCYWDQRGAGMSYSKNLDADTVTLEQLIEDTAEVSRYLSKRFGQKKIYIMGHSWGSYLGIKTIEKYPELYLAYFGTGQISDQKKSEKLAYEYMLAHAQEINDQKAIKDLQKYDVDADSFPQTAYIMSTRTSLMNKYGIGVQHEDFSMLGMTKDILLFHGYTFPEKIAYVRGMMFSQLRLFSNVTMDNLFESSTHFEVPVYILHGAYDYQVSYQLAQKYVEHITAPDKEFISFENSAHSPIFEEPEKYAQTVVTLVEQLQQ